MVEQGLVLLIQAGLAAGGLSVPGGWPVQLPQQMAEDWPMAWTYRSITAPPSYTLDGEDGYTEWNVQIDCHGFAYADAIRLARGIDEVLRGGFAGVLPDPDSTVVQGIFRSDPFIDGFSDADRSYVRTLEYTVVYDQI